MVLFGWRWLVLHDVSWSDFLLIFFWAIWPDLAAFLPIGLASKGAGH